MRGKKRDQDQGYCGHNLFAVQQGNARMITKVK